MCGDQKGAAGVTRYRRPGFLVGNDGYVGLSEVKEGQGVTVFFTSPIAIPLVDKNSKLS